VLPRLGVVGYYRHRPRPAVSGPGTPATPDVEGDIDYAPLWAGESCSVVNDIKPTAAPDNVTSASLAIAISASGAFRTFETTVLITQDELLKALEKAQDVEYAAPGGPSTPK
jgi:hypothetical protein